ncbi:MAG: hypothetical protein H6651_06075 [Ardenticatenales bacterium]|nr:hypothetical protein [Ardenticatenales bacterium]
MKKTTENLPLSAKANTTRADAAGNKEPQISARTPSLTHLREAGVPHSPDTVLRSQRQLGNKTTTQLLQDRQQAAASEANTATPKTTGPSLHTNGPLAGLQRFDAKEHKKMGDRGSGKKQVALAPDYVLSYGDVVAMAGDHFASIAQMRQFARKKSGKESRGEIEYVREWKLKQRGRQYDPEAKKAATERYYALAAKNRSHFVNPDEKDADRTLGEKATDYTLERGGAGEAIPIPANAVAGYHSNHVIAIREAVKAGAAGESIQNALAADAFASHFLTDAFSAGHVRVPRAAAQTYWNAKVPLFFHNLQGFMAEKIAEELRKTNAKASIDWFPDIKYKHLSEQMVYEKALAKIRKALSNMGRVDFGDLVGLALHDWDNVAGIEATSDGKDVSLKGDGQAKKQDEEKLAIKAVARSVAEIEKAYALGQKGERGQVEKKLRGKDGLFAAERMIPVAKEDDALTGTQPNKSIPWKFNSPFTLFKEARFKAALAVFAREKANEVKNVAASFDKAQQDAMRNGIIRPLLKNPTRIIKQIINWTPQTGGGVGGHDTDDNAQDYYRVAARTAGGLASLTVIQRIRLIRDLDAGFVTFESEEEAIWDILNSASDASARQVIKKVGWDKIAGMLSGAEDRKFRQRFPRQSYR